MKRVVEHVDVPTPRGSGKSAVGHELKIAHLENCPFRTHYRPPETLTRAWSAITPEQQQALQQAMQA